MRQIIEFGEYAPDMPPSGNPGLKTAKNVYAYSQGYRPIGAFQQASGALPAACTGFHSDYRVNGNVITFAGTSTGLYWLNSTAWTDKSLTTYAATTPWVIVRFKDFLIAVAAGVNPQKWDLKTAFDPSAGGNKWANLGGSPPQFRYAGVCKQFLICGDEYADGVRYDQRLRWCARDDMDDWTAAPDTTGSDYQDLDSGGPLRGVFGGEYAVVFQERSIRRMMPVADTTIVFQIDRVEFNRGALCSGGVVQQGNMFYYLSEDGFFAFDGNSSNAIGHGKVNKTFFNDLSFGYVGNIKSAVDPYNKLVIWYYPSRYSGTGALDNGICYNYEEGKWSTIDLGANIEYIADGISQGYTLEDIGLIYSSLDDVRPPLDDNFWQSGYRAAYFFTSADHKMGVLRGDLLGTQITTGDFQLGGDDYAGKKKLTRYVRPGADADTAYCRVGYRNDLKDDVSYTTALLQNARGIVPARGVGRYHCIDLTTQAGSDFQTEHGCEVEFETAGDL